MNEYVALVSHRGDLWALTKDGQLYKIVVASAENHVTSVTLKSLLPRIEKNAATEEQR